MTGRLKWHICIKNVANQSQMNLIPSAATYAASTFLQLFATNLDHDFIERNA